VTTVILTPTPWELTTTEPLGRRRVWKPLSTSRCQARNPRYRAAMPLSEP